MSSRVFLSVTVSIAADVEPGVGMGEVAAYVLGQPTDDIRTWQKVWGVDVQIENVTVTDSK